MIEILLRIHLVSSPISFITTIAQSKKHNVDQLKDTERVFRLGNIARSSPSSNMNQNTNNNLWTLTQITTIHHENKGK